MLGGWPGAVPCVFRIVRGLWHVVETTVVREKVWDLHTGQGCLVRIFRATGLSPMLRSLS